MREMLSRWKLTPIKLLGYFNRGTARTTGAAIFPDAAVMEEKPH
jgi:hypothetical protein